MARLDYYEVAELEVIVRRSAGVLGGQAGALGRGRRSPGVRRGTPRLANRLLKRVRDYADVRGDGTIDHATARAGLELFQVDELGLDKVDRAILEATCCRFGGGPVGLSTLAVARGRGAGNGRGRLRAVPPAARHADADPPGPGGDAPGLGAPRAAGAGAPGPAR